MSALCQHVRQHADRARFTHTYPAIPIGPQVLPASFDALTTIGRLTRTSGLQPSARPSAKARMVPLGSARRFGIRKQA